MAQIIHNISTPNSGLGDALRTGFDNQNKMNTELYSNKVDKVAGKDLSDNNLTDELVAKINDVQDLADRNIQVDWDQEDDNEPDYIKNKPDQLFASVGYFDYSDSATQSTPITVTGGVGNVLLTNDALGAATDLSQAPYGVTTIWDSSLNSFDFSQLENGDVIDIRLDLKITTSNTNTEIEVALLSGDLTPVSTIFVTPKNYKNIVADSQIVEYKGIYIGSDDIRLNESKFYIKSDKTCTVKVNGWYCKVLRRGINLVKVDNQDLQSVTNEGSITDANVTTQSGTSTGTRVAADLNVIIGDYDDSGNSTKITIDDDLQSATLEDSEGGKIGTEKGLVTLEYGVGEGVVIKSNDTGYSANIDVDLLTDDRTIQHQDKDGIIAHLDDIGADDTIGLNALKEEVTDLFEIDSSVFNGNLDSSVDTVQKLAVAVDDLVGTGAPVDSVNGQTGVVELDKADIGLDQVDNTSDINKPVSTATNLALGFKADEDDVLSKTNSVLYVPTQDYHPATKKYVDESSGGTAGDPNYLGSFATETALTTAYPTAVDGNYAIVQSTDTVWIWDTDTLDWVDTATPPGSIALNSIGLLELKDEVKDLLYMQRVEMGATNVIDWINPNFTFLRNDLTANITITDTNLPQDFNTKEITLKVNIKTYAIDFPIYYNHMGGDWEEDVINTILIQCENGNSGSEVVNYWVNPKTV